MTDAAWSALLDRFEGDLAVDATPQPWTAPDSPLPDALAERAAGLLARQHDRMRRLAAERDEVQNQLAALRLVPGTQTDTPGFLDATG